ncbi:hypothetical protein KLP40_09345 [Hymenobacter sp. NST-14]|uniref:transposase n=1 Tax=Hymenobacter piscis TaxID=2839984 RepID=UPI001C018E3E|nr:transposase [Hymenobacter piscis]MBT9393366.1 hypothetical protein [Hymenobacter piscis]
MESGLYQDKYRVASARWIGHDYGQNGMYFVTICTQHRKRYFGEIKTGQRIGEESKLRPTELADRALTCWLDVPQHFPFALPDAFVVMPDHIHGILLFEKATAETERPNTFGPQRQNLAAVVRGFKVGVKSWATRHNQPFNWQAGYHDRVIRNEQELEKARQYILQNPSQWAASEDKPDGIFR